MSQYKKPLFLSIFGGMTFMTLSASNWQWNRYQDAKRRWQNFENDMKDFNSQELKLKDLPFRVSNLNDWENRLIKVEGKIDKDIVFVSRFREARFGYNIIGCLKDQENNGIIVNLGQIPQDDQWLEKTKKEYGEQNQQTSNIIGVIRKPEVIDVLNKAYTQEQLDGYQSFINVEEISNKLNLKNKDLSKLCFVEKIKKFSEHNQQEELYPVVDNEKNVIKPYLTPQKHLEYSIFWGSCSIIGFFALRKIKKTTYI